MARTKRAPRAKAAASPPAASDREVVIQIDQRAFYAVLGVLGLVTVLVIGFFVGRGMAGGQAAQPVVTSQQALTQQQLQQQQQQLAEQLQVDAEGNLQLRQVSPEETGGLHPNLVGYTPARIDESVAGTARVAVSDLDELYAYDFGNVSFGQIVDHVFTVKNVGSQELRFDPENPVYTACGCTAVILGDQVLPPGVETQLRVSFNPDEVGDLGPVERFVQIFSNDPMGGGEIRILIRANIVP